LTSAGLMLSSVTQDVDECRDTARDIELGA
jgi:hypothetical protein